MMHIQIEIKEEKEVEIKLHKLNHQSNPLIPMHRNNLED
jgi:hypothetical protein